MPRAVESRSDQLGHPGVEHDLAAGTVADVQDPRHEPTGAGDQRPTRLDREARRAAISGDGVQQRPELPPKALRGRCGFIGRTDREAAAQIHGVERRDRATPQRCERERLAHRVTPCVHGAQLGTDMEVDPSRPKRTIRAAAGLDRGRDLGLGHPELRGPGADSQAGERLRRDIRVEPVQDVQWGRAGQPRCRRQRGRFLRRLDGDPAQRFAVARGARRGPEVGRRLADPLQRDPVIPDAGPACEGPLAA
jgi:hypothetical protein